MNIIDTILMVDDDEATNFLHEIIITDANSCNNLIIIDDAEKALEMLKNDLKPNLLFLDINMPKMNGWEFLDLFKQTKKGNDLPLKIIIFSTSLNPRDKEKAQEYKNVSFMSKPLTGDLVKEIVDEYFLQKKSI